MRQDLLSSSTSPFESLEHERRKRLMIATANVLILLLGPVSLPFIAMVITVPSWQTITILSWTLAMAPVLLLARSLAKRDHPERGGYVFLFYMMSMIFANGTLVDGLFVAVAPAFFPFLVMAGMVGGPSGAYVMTAFGSVLWLFGLWLTTNIILPPVTIPAFVLIALIVVIVIVCFILTAILSQLATQDLRRTLNDATYDLVQANRQLEEANSLKSQFMARTSHELRTPLNSIIGFSDLAVRKVYGPLTDLQDEGLKRVLSNARRLLTLINDILDLSKIEAGEMQLIERDFKLRNLIDTVEATLAPRAKEKGVKLTMFVSPELPAEMLGDEVRLSQVIMNLVDNAIKYTDEGEVEANFEPIGTTQWRIKVRDTGRGIHEKDLNRIFEEFYQGQADVPGARRDGAGLGLSITNHLVKLMKGKISVDSRLGKGSTFEVMLPMHAPQAAPAAPVEATA